MRLRPFDLVFRPAAAEIFPQIRSALTQAGYDPRDRDGFLMVREVVTLLRDLRPDEGIGEGIDQLAALLHHAYLFWASGEHTVEVTADRLSALMASSDVTGSADSTVACYVAIPPHRVWADVMPGQPPEPMDGCFVDPGLGRTLRVLGVFGIHPERPGFTVVEAAGERPMALGRADGSDLFAPTLVGGKAAGLFSITGEEELLELGWRIQLGARSGELGARGADLEATVPSSQPPAPGS
jgi:hypothetical protein